MIFDFDSVYNASGFIRSLVDHSLAPRRVLIVSNSYETSRCVFDNIGLGTWGVFRHVDFAVAKSNGNRITAADAKNIGYIRSYRADVIVAINFRGLSDGTKEELIYIDSKRTQLSDLHEPKKIEITLDGSSIMTKIQEEIVEVISRAAMSNFQDKLRQTVEESITIS
jgi:hypothetical protein